MKKFKLLTVGVTASVCMLCLSGCSAEHELKEDMYTNETITDSEDVTDGFVCGYMPDPMEDVRDDYIKCLAGTFNENMTVDKKIKVLSWTEIDETQTAADLLFRYVYDLPEYGSKEYESQFANRIFVTEKVAYKDRYSRLASLVSSGKSPDMFPFEVKDFPYSAVMGLFQPVDGYIDFSCSVWDGTEEVMKKFFWESKHYCAVTGLELDKVLWYRRCVCADNNIYDPYWYFQDGEWNWDTFIEVCGKFSHPEMGKYAIDGYYVPDSITLTTGVPLVEIKDGKLSHNLYSPNIERAMSYVVDNLSRLDFRKPRSSGESISISEWVNGDILFLEGVENDILDTFQTYIRSHQWRDNDLWFVPYPKDPDSSSDYYQSMTVDGFMLCSGAENTTGYAAWQLCCAYMANDRDAYIIRNDVLKMNYLGYTDELIEWLDHLKRDSVLTPVFEFKGALNQNFVDYDIDDPVNSITQFPYFGFTDENGEPLTFSSLCRINETAVEERINAVNCDELQ